MYETKTSDLLLSEAIDIVGRHVCADNWQGKNSLKNKDIRYQIDQKFIEIMLSAKVACWFLDDQDMPQEITPSIVTAGTFSIALISGAILLGREGRWYHGKFNKDDLISYLDGGQSQSDIDTLENWLKKHSTFHHLIITKIVFFIWRLKNSNHLEDRTCLDINSI